MTQSLDLALSASIILNAILAWVGFLLLGKRMILKDELNGTREDLSHALSDVDALINKRDALQRQLNEATGDTSPYEQGIPGSGEHDTGFNARKKSAILANLAGVGKDEDVDMVNHPKHYNSLGAKCPCGRDIECIDVIEHMGLSLGNVVKYTWRANHKNDALEDLKKARWYLDREIGRLEGRAEQ